MPHATTDNLASSSTMTDEDIDIPDAPPADTNHDGAALSHNILEGDQSFANSGSKQDVKLEDLFDDDEEEDDEEGLVNSSAPTLDMDTAQPDTPKSVFTTRITNIN